MPSYIVPGEEVYKRKMTRDDFIVEYVRALKRHTHEFWLQTPYGGPPAGTPRCLNDNCQVPMGADSIEFRNWHNLPYCEACFDSEHREDAIQEWASLERSGFIEHHYTTEEETINE